MCHSDPRKGSCMGPGMEISGEKLAQPNKHIFFIYSVETQGECHLLLGVIKTLIIANYPSEYI